MEKKFSRRYKPLQIYSKEELMSRIVGKAFNYGGKRICAVKFDDHNYHAEPCGDCIWGLSSENFTCKRPKDFPQCCTCNNRSDHTNVFFRYESVVYVPVVLKFHLRRCSPSGIHRKPRFKKKITTKR